MKFVAILLVLIPIIFAEPVDVDKRFLDFHHTFDAVKDFVKNHVLTPGMETTACKSACAATVPGGALFCGPVCTSLVSSLNNGK